MKLLTNASDNKKYIKYTFEANTAADFLAGRSGLFILVSLTDAKKLTSTPYNLEVNVFRTVPPSFSSSIDSIIELVVGAAK